MTYAKSLYGLPFLLGLTVTSGCLDAFDGPAGTGGSAVEAINGDSSAPATSASQFQRDRAIAIPGCTATRISPRHALTAMHCGATVGSTVTFYTTGPGTNGALSATIQDVIRRPGTSVSACQATQGTLSTTGCEDATGTFADLVILRLGNVVTASGPDSLDGAAATMAWRYPGAGVTGQKVGAGAHDGNPNPTRILLQVSDDTDSGDDSSGRFYTDNIRVDPGDSGGPFYTSGRVLGTLYGSQGLNGLHTSVPKHLDWILANIGYAWVGTPPQSNIAYSGSLLESFVATERVCQYACEKTQSCQAYNYLTASSSCGLYSNVTHTFSNTNTHSALHYGQSSARSGTVVGYVRSDGLNAVVHAASDGLLHEFTPGATDWVVGGLPTVNSPALPLPARGARLSAYRRADGINAVVYRSSANRVIEVALTDRWRWGDLTSWGGQTPAGDPVGYVRADGVSAVVFRSADGHVNELRLIPQGWMPLDLSAASGVPAAATSDPSAYVRSEGLSSVVFRSSDQIFELFKATGKAWDWGEPSAVTVDGAPPSASNKPFGYTHHDGTNAIVYTSNIGDIVELYLASDGWRWGWLGGPKAIGNPTANVRSDGIEHVVYRSTANQIQELTNTPWQAWNLTIVTGGPTVTSDPSVYVRADGYNSVVYPFGANHAGELSWHIGDPQWMPGDLTFNSHETP